MTIHFDINRSMTVCRAVGIELKKSTVLHPKMHDGTIATVYSTTLLITGKEAETEFTLFSKDKPFEDKVIIPITEKQMPGVSMALHDVTMVEVEQRTCPTIIITTNHGTMELSIHFYNGERVKDAVLYDVEASDVQA